MSSSLPLVSLALAISWTLVTTNSPALSESWHTCILNVTLLDLKGRDDSKHDLCVTRDNKVNIFLHCVTGSRYGSRSSLNPCLQAQPFVTLHCGSMGDQDGQTSMVMWMEEGGKVVDTTHHTFHPPDQVVTVLPLKGDLNETRFTVAVSRRCVTGKDSDKPPTPVRSVIPPMDSVQPPVSLNAHTDHMPSLRTQRHKREAGNTQLRSPFSKSSFLAKHNRHLRDVMSSDDATSDSVVVDSTGNADVTSSSSTLPSGTSSGVRMLISDITDDFGEDNLVVQGRGMTESPFFHEDADTSENGVTTDGSSKVSDSSVPLPDSGEPETTAVSERGVNITESSDLKSSVITTSAETERVTPTHGQPVTFTGTTTTPRTSSLSPSTTVAQTNTATENKQEMSSMSGSTKDTKDAQSSPDSTNSKQTTSALNSNAEQTTEDITNAVTNSITTDSVTSDSSFPADHAGNSSSEQSQSTPHSTSTQRGGSPSTDAKPTTPAQTPSAMTPVPSAIFSSTPKSATTAHSNRQDSNPNSGGSSDEAFWPIVAALVIGVPSIIVFGIAIVVIHKRRRVASPSNRLRAASMYSS
ncbi:uncharacterized protein LOC143297501 [Babylonia areolata]|uniref:uncharacterized protein LOC143297501 n=1 Tax=Babylonia areolata TaxID=304850 RepID=UPI003FD22518